MERRVQNRALKEWREVRLYVDQLDPIMANVLARGRYTTGIRRSEKSGEPPPSYADETGETATSEEVADRVGTAVTLMYELIARVRSIVKWVVDEVPNTAPEAVLRAIPTCDACDQPIFGRVKAKYHVECYNRKIYLRIADRAEFRRVRLAELSEEDSTTIPTLKGKLV